MESLTIPLRMRCVSQGIFSLWIVALRPENPMPMCCGEALLIWSGKPRRYLNTGAKLIRTMGRHLVTWVQIPKYLYQVACPDTCPHIHPFRSVIHDADDECTFQVACH